MKTKLYTLIIVILMVNFSFASGGKGPGKNNKSQPAMAEIGLIVYGTILNTDLPRKNVEIRLFEQNDHVMSCKVNRNGEFELPLFLNQEYVVEIYAAGFLPKRFYFNTRVPGSTDKLHVFGFSAELLRTDKVRGADTFSLDFPFALVRYDENSEEFSFSAKYSEQMKHEENEAIHLSQSLIK